MRDELVRRAREVFRSDLDAVPPMTLRGGDAVDSYDHPPPYDAEADRPTDAYLERHAYWGLTYLDSLSWRHYLPRLIEYAFAHLGDRRTMVIVGLLWALRPPDREPPRLASLSSEQEAVIVALLEELASAGDAEAYHEDAHQVLEEWWTPRAHYRLREAGQGHDPG